MTEVASDKTREWIPTRKQEILVGLPNTILEAFYAGAVAAGKTDVLLTLPILRGWHELEGFKGLFLRRTFPELKNEVIPRSHEYYRPFGAKYNASDKVWKFPSGALIFFGHVEEEKDVHKYDSMQPNYVAFDELTSFTEWQYLYITLQRVRSRKDSGLPAVVRSASNPGNIGHNWVRRRFVDPDPNGLKILSNEKGLLRIFIPATVKDNPHIDPQYLRSLESLPEAEKQAKLYGRWDAYQGSVFDEFRDKNYPDEPDNALHVVEPFDIPDYWPKIVAMDWGYAPPAMTWVGYGALSPEGRVYIYREQAWQKTKISEWGPYVREHLDKENPFVIKLCKSGGQDRGQEHTIQGDIELELGRAVELSNNSPGSRVAGKMLLHEYLRWKQRYRPVMVLPPFDQEKADWYLRNRGMKEYESYINSYKQPEPEKFLPKLQIFNNCKLLINAIKSAIYDDTNPQDVAEFDGDDPYDGIRYLLDACDRYFSVGAVEHRKFVERDELTKSLETTGDMNAFYNRARALERKNNSGTYGVKRYRRVR
jgi:hypothetical protein